MMAPGQGSNRAGGWAVIVMDGNVITRRAAGFQRACESGLGVELHGLVATLRMI